MSVEVFKGIELALFFGAFWLICWLQLRSVNKSIAEDKAKKTNEQALEQDEAPTEAQR